MYLFLDRDWVGVPQMLAALLLAAALLFLSFGSDTRARSSASPAISPASAPAPRIAVRREVSGRSFDVAGASFLVTADPRRGWAGSLRSAAGRGHHWVMAAVDVVNRGRDGFDPGLLTYLLRGPGGAMYAPERAGVVGPRGLGLASGLPLGASAEERLVFSVPDSLRHPVLAIQPSPSLPLEARIPLG